MKDKINNVAYVITTNLPDGKNYWCGTQEIFLAGTTEKMITDIWSVWRNQAYLAGVFYIREEAVFYMNNYIDTKGCTVETIIDSKKEWRKYHRYKLILQFVKRLAIRNSWFGIDLWAEIGQPEFKKSRVERMGKQLNKVKGKFLKHK
jgi:hypothetical protein